MKDDLTEKFFGPEDEALPDPIELELLEPSPEAAEEEPPSSEDAQPEPEPQPDPPPAPAPPAPAAPEPGHVPLAVVLDEREKRQKAERERDELIAKQAKAPEPQPVPDQFLDPQGYQAYQEQQRENDRWQGTLHTSALLAVDKHGQETVDSAIKWFVERQSADPTLAQAVRRQVHPVEYAIKEYQRHQMNEGAPTDGDPAALARFYAQKAGIVLPETTAPQPVIRQPQARPLPPASIVDKPSQPVQVGAQSKKTTDTIKQLFEAE